MKQKALLLFTLLLILSGASPAMTVDCPPFEEKVQLAQLIFDGTVTHVAARNADLPMGRHGKGGPYTFYTFAMQRVFKGSVAGGGDTVTLRFEGGEVYDAQGKLVDEESIPGLPRFKVGDRAILFVANNGDVMSPLVCMIAEYRIWRPDDLPRDSQEAWITRDNEVVFKPSEERLRHLAKMLKDQIARDKAETDEFNRDKKPSPPSKYHPFEVHIKELMGVQGSEAKYLTPQGIWMPPLGAKPYDQDAYADIFAERIEKELDRQVTAGKFVAPEPVESQDINKPFYVGGGFGRALDKHGNRLHPDAK